MPGLLESSCQRFEEEQLILAFIDAVRPFDPTWANIQDDAINNSMINRTPLPPIDVVVEQFRNKRRLDAAKVHSHEHQASSYATFQGEDQDKPSDHTMPDPDITASTTPTTKKPWQRRSGPSQCPCGTVHFWGTCPYLIESKRLSGWKPDLAILKRIDKKCKKSRNLRQLIQKVQDKDLKRQATIKADEQATQPLQAISAVTGVYLSPYAPLANAFSTVSNV
jgi:hypothetical protein